MSQGFCVSDSIGNFLGELRNCGVLVSNPEVFANFLRSTGQGWRKALMAMAAQGRSLPGASFIFAFRDKPVAPGVVRDLFRLYELDVHVDDGAYMRFLACIRMERPSEFFMVGDEQS